MSDLPCIRFSHLGRSKKAKSCIRRVCKRLGGNMEDTGNPTLTSPAPTDQNENRGREDGRAGMRGVLLANAPSQDEIQTSRSIFFSFLIVSSFLLPVIIPGIAAYLYRDALLLSV